MHYFIALISFLFFISCAYSVQRVDPTNTLVWGPGLKPQLIVLPARYFFIQCMDENRQKIPNTPEKKFDITITGQTKNNNRPCKFWINILDRKDGSFIVRYKLYESCSHIKIEVKYDNQHVSQSPYLISEMCQPEECYCPYESFETWYKNLECPQNYDQIDSDLKHFNEVNFTSLFKSAIKKFNKPHSMSVCNYAIIQNKIFRRCYGQHVDFKMFVDAILLSLARKVQLPDMEFFINLGDWPLVTKRDNPRLPIFSWCGSDDTLDIVLPTYDLTESTLENMGRVSLDMLSVQGNIDNKWESKINKAFWRGRDSNHERLKLIELSRQYPDLINASLTNFFFFKDKENVYGPSEKRISFFKFFDYKYQINLDGTVAAYRFPYLLMGNSLVFKQNSKYYEHFYKQLTPWIHYIPFKKDLSDLIDKLNYALENDEKVRNISTNGQQFAQKNLLPVHILCYHAALFKEWSARLISPVKLREGMEYVKQPDFPCNCIQPDLFHDEL